MPLRRIAIALLVLLSSLAAQEATTLTTGSPSDVLMDGATLDRAVQLYRDAVKRDDLRGCVLLVARRGKIVLHEAVGWRHAAYGLPMEKDTLFRMASNTKPVVATGALMLVEEGKLALDGKVADRFDSFAHGDAAKIELGHLLSHTSGLRIRPIFFPFDGETKPTLRSAVDKFGKIGPEEKPGTTYSYSNAGYNTIGALIADASGATLEEFLVKRIYEPLGMVDSLHHEDPRKLRRMATVYRGSRKDDRIVFRQRWTPGDPPDFPVIRASGGMISTASDYARFLQMILNGGAYGDVRILPEEMVARATRAQAKREKGGYGLGWAIAADGTFGHGGSDGTWAWVDPGRELFGIVFTQSPGGRNPSRRFKKLVEEACLPRR